MDTAAHDAAVDKANTAANTATDARDQAAGIADPAYSAICTHAAMADAHAIGASEAETQAKADAHAYAAEQHADAAQTWLAWDGVGDPGWAEPGYTARQAAKAWQATAEADALTDR